MRGRAAVSCRHQPVRSPSCKRRCRWTTWFPDRRQIACYGRPGPRPADGLAGQRIVTECGVSASATPRHPGRVPDRPAGRVGAHRELRDAAMANARLLLWPSGRLARVWWRCCSTRRPPTCSPAHIGRWQHSSPLEAGASSRRTGRRSWPSTATGRPSPGRINQAIPPRPGGPTAPAGRPAAGSPPPAATQADPPPAPGSAPP